jgi:hypothetical protein
VQFGSLRVIRVQIVPPSFRHSSEATLGHESQGLSRKAESSHEPQEPSELFVLFGSFRVIRVQIVPP